VKIQGIYGCLLNVNGFTLYRSKPPDFAAAIALSIKTIVLLIVIGAAPRCGGRGRLRL
jgi:hypothetical protein